MASRAEKEFMARFPYASAREGSVYICEVYAGEYLVSEGRTRQAAFKAALDYVDTGLVTPDPNEMAKGKV